MENITDYERIPLGRAGNTCQRYEIASFGVDENLQCQGDGPFSPQTSMGLRVPTLATPAFGSVEGSSKGRFRRYLFCLASVTIGAHQKKRICGLRQFWSIGAYTQAAGGGNPNRAIEFPVAAPNWRLTNSNVSWHLRKMTIDQFPYTLNTAPKVISRDASNFMYRWSSGSPALLYETASFNAANLDAAGRPDYYTTLTAYTPPNLGRPYGEAIMGLGDFSDIRYPWDSPYAWSSLGGGQCFEGPCQIVFFATVRQTSAAGAGFPTIPVGSYANAPDGYMPAGILPEDQFVMNAQQTGGTPWVASSLKIWRVSGAILVEDAS